MIRQHYSTKPAEALVLEPGVLAVIQFNRECRPSGDAGIIPIGLESLNHYQCEIIESSGGGVMRGIDDGCYWSASDALMLSAAWISPEACQNIEQGAEQVYSQILELVRAKGYPHPFRFWNFIPDINLGAGDQEEYKKFCVGRLKAYTRSGLTPESFPAASALGHHGKGAVVYVLSSKNAGTHYENPSQERAYRYPRQYGTSSPSFARATGVNFAKAEVSDHERWVFISGTASIRGHETKAAGDIVQQLHTTAENIAILCEHISQRPQNLSALRVYLRHKADLNICQAFIQQRYPGIEVNYLYADICRANLLVEMEAAFQDAR